jgi:hypothetical protein
MPFSVLAWDRQVPAPTGWFLPVGGQVMPCLVLAWDRQVPVPLRLVSARVRSGEALLSVATGQAGRCLPQAYFCPLEVM